MLGVCSLLCCRLRVVGQAVARIEARLAAFNQLDSTIKACEASYPSIDVTGLKQWVVLRAEDDTIQAEAIEVCYSETQLQHRKWRWSLILTACVCRVVLCACSLWPIHQSQHNDLLSAMDAADADAATAMAQDSEAADAEEQQEEASGGSDDDDEEEGEEAAMDHGAAAEQGQEHGVATHRPAKRRRLDGAAESTNTSDAALQREF